MTQIGEPEQFLLRGPEVGLPAEGGDEDFDFSTAKGTFRAAEEMAAIIAADARTAHRQSKETGNRIDRDGIQSAAIAFQSIVRLVHEKASMGLFTDVEHRGLIARQPQPVVVNNILQVLQHAKRLGISHQLLDETESHLLAQAAAAGNGDDDIID